MTGGGQQWFVVVDVVGSRLQQCTVKQQGTFYEIPFSLLDRSRVYITVDDSARIERKYNFCLHYAF